MLQFMLPIGNSLTDRVTPLRMLMLLQQTTLRIAQVYLSEEKIAASRTLFWTMLMLLVALLAIQQRLFSQLTATLQRVLLESQLRTHLFGVVSTLVALLVMDIHILLAVLLRTAL